MRTVINVKNSILFLVLFFYTMNQNASEINRCNELSNSKDSERMYVTVLIYLKEGMKSTFEEYKQKATPIVERYGAKIERRIQPLKLAKGDMNVPDEIHIASFPSSESLSIISADPAYQKLVETLRNKSVEKLVFIPCKLSDFKFTREVGDETKTYGMAFLNYNEGMKTQFGEYHEEACEILPEFGAHFERFLIPVAIQGDFKKPDEIHLFYFDSPDGMMKMGQDPRMQKLFPKRDASLSDLNFIIGKAI